MDSRHLRRWRARMPALMHAYHILKHAGVIVAVDLLNVAANRLGEQTWKARDLVLAGAVLILVKIMGWVY